MSACSSLKFIKKTKGFKTTLDRLAFLFAALGAADTKV